MAAIPTSERNALIAFYNATGGGSWTSRSNWLGAPGTEGSWTGVTLDATNSHVTKLRLTTNNLTGGVPADIAALPELIELDLQGNHLTGALPAGLGSLAKLKLLDLTYNPSMAGPIPPEIGGCVQLVTLRLTSCSALSGSIPPQIGNLHALEWFGLTYTGITGSIPAEIGGCTALKTLYLDNTQLSGPLPSTIGNLVNLEEFYFDHTQISGALPSSMGNLAKLRTLWGQWLQLSGALPPEMGSLTALKDLQLQGNALTGSIPSSWGGMASIETLELSGNELTGSIPLSLGSLGALKYLGLGYNQLSGPIPDTLGNCTQLVALELHRNQLTGSIPTTLGNLVNLQRLYLNDNQISGPIPASLGNFTQMVYFHLEYNQLTGPIPAQLTNLANATDIYLDGNKLTGPLPTDWSKLTKVRYLYLHSNAITGPIPASFTSMTALDGLSLVYNGLYPSSPAVKTFVDSKEIHSNWLDTQTLAPANVAPGQVGGTTVQLTWTPVTYTWNPGGYEIYLNDALRATVPGKSNSSYTVTGLMPDTAYVFKVRSYTDPHGLNASRVDSEFSPDLTVKTAQCAGGLQVGGLAFCADSVTKHPTQNLWTLHGNVKLNGVLTFTDDVVVSGNGAVPTAGTLTSSGAMTVVMGADTDTLMGGPLSYDLDGTAGTLAKTSPDPADVYALRFAGMPLFINGKPITVTGSTVDITPLVFLGPQFNQIASVELALRYTPKAAPPAPLKQLLGATVASGQLNNLGIQVPTVAMAYDPSTDTLSGTISLQFPSVASLPTMEAIFTVKPDCWNGHSFIDSYQFTWGLVDGIPLGDSGLEVTAFRLGMDDICAWQTPKVLIGGDMGMIGVPSQVFAVNKVGLQYQHPWRFGINGGTMTIMTQDAFSLGGFVSAQQGALGARVYADLSILNALNGRLAFAYWHPRHHSSGNFSGDLTIPDFSCGLNPFGACRTLRVALLTKLGSLPYTVAGIDLGFDMARSQVTGDFRGEIRGMLSVRGWSGAASLEYDTGQNPELRLYMGRNYNEMYGVTAAREATVETLGTERPLALASASDNVYFSVESSTALPAIYLRTPDGQTITPDTAAAFPGVTYGESAAERTALFHLDHVDAGTWTLGASNLSPSEATFVALAPQTPSQVAITKVLQAGGSVALEAKVTPGSADTTVTFYFSDVPWGDGGAVIAEDLPATSGTVSANWDISGLAAGSYYILAKADDGKNARTVAYAAQAVVVGGSVQPPTNLSGTRTPDDAVLTWTPSASAGITGYSVLYTDRPDLPGYPYQVMTISDAGATVGPLDASKQYRFAAVAVGGGTQLSAESNAWYTGTLPPSDVRTLPEGLALSDNVAAAAWRYYKIVVPQFPLSLTVTTTGAGGDVDLYLRKGSKPTAAQHDYAAITGSGDETIAIDRASAPVPLGGGEWFMGVYGKVGAGFTIRATVQGGLRCTVSCTPTAPGWAAPGAQVSFGASASTSGCQGGIRYEWDFGDGSPRSTDQNPGHTYALAGTYTWTCAASTDESGTVRSGTLTVSSTPPPCTLACQTAVPADVQTGIAAAFSASASASNCAGAAAFAWSFGDGSPGSSQPAVTHAYALAGTYAWSLTVTAGGNTCTKSGTLRVTGPPACTLTCSASAPSSGGAGTALAFTATSAPVDCTQAVTYDWDFGDGSAHGAGASVSHTYTSGGTFTWTMTAGADGVTCAKTGSITVAPPCTVTCSATVPSTGEGGAAIAFTGSATASGCSGTPAFLWTFGDGQGSTLQIPSHTYAAAGSYAWTFAATAESATCTKSGTITITAPPCSLSCSATAPTTATAQREVAFQSSVTATGCLQGPYYDWSFGDGSGHSQAQNPSHTYNSAGVYTWTLTVTADTQACTRSGSVTVVEPVPPPVIALIKKTSPPWKIVVTGSNLQQGIRVFIDGTEWGSVVWKKVTKIQLTGAIKAAVPKGATRTFRFLNPDGGEATQTWGW